MVKIYRSDTGTFSGLRRMNSSGSGGFKMHNGGGNYKLTSDGKRIRQILEVYEPLPTTIEGDKNFRGYINKNGDWCIVYQLVGGKHYSFGANKSPQKRLIVDNEGADEIRFIEDGKELTLEEMLMSQLKGTGKYIYFKNPITDQIEITNKANINKLIRIDPLVAKIYSQLRPQAKK